MTPLTPPYVAVTSASYTTSTAPPADYFCVFPSFTPQLSVLGGVESCRTNPHHHCLAFLHHLSPPPPLPHNTKPANSSQPPYHHFSLPSLNTFQHTVTTTAHSAHCKVLPHSVSPPVRISPSAHRQVREIQVTFLLETIDFLP